MIAYSTPDIIEQDYDVITHYDQLFSEVDYALKRKMYLSAYNLLCDNFEVVSNKNMPYHLKMIADLWSLDYVRSYFTGRSLIR